MKSHRFLLSSYHSIHIWLLHVLILCNCLTLNLFRCRRDNLYNTNEQFDYGGFRELIEAQSQTSTSTTLFAYRFRDPGVYVFYLSSDVNKRIVRTESDAEQ